MLFFVSRETKKEDSFESSNKVYDSYRYSVTNNQRVG